MKTTSIFRNTALIVVSIFLFSCSLDKDNRYLDLTTKSSDELNPEEFFYFEEAGIYLKRTDEHNDIVDKGWSGKTKRYHAIRFFPKDIDEQLFLSNFKDVAVSYIPWGYDPVAGDIVAKSSTNAVKPYKAERENPHYIENVIDGDTTILHLPVMYAVWPDDLDFPSVEYDVIEDLDIPIIDPEPSNRYTLTLRTYDSLLGSYLPLKNIKVHFKLGAFSVYLTTNNQGTVQITPSAYVNAPANISNINVYVLPGTSYFTVSRNHVSSNGSTSTIAIIETLGTLGSIYGTPGASNPLTHTETLYSSTTEYEIYRAADYYFNETHYLSSNMSSGEGGTLLLADDSSNPTYSGQASPSNNIVYIYNNGHTMPEIIGTTLHEIGHIRHYKKATNQYLYSIDRFVKDSYASFVGWLLGEEYYLSKGFIKPYHGYHINDENRQDWHKNMTTDFYYYSPIFIDLWDNYNQSQEFSFGIPETIWLVSLPVIEGMASQTSLSGCLNYLSGYIGQEFSLSDYNILLNYYQ